MSEQRNYPVPREGHDLRWSFSVTNAVAKVLEDRGYPEFTGLDRIELNTALFRFLYEREDAS